MTNRHLVVAEALFELEREMRSLELWESQSPSREALASSQPFAVDTLRFPQWLQFIFIPRLYQLVEHRSSLPVDCGVAPMAEEYFRPLSVNSDQLVNQLQEIDQLLSHK
ncbi:YqcC family protein [Marinimicrobium sp. ABcell2]|uniref:YqcC family protein n=1 Tax=Marinimicrobium sp. ABcell2 TaxID=3069751 RepID=UPI0027B37FEB|nr:YqcC family protein [Marinimicrobium sp. ABcell2]MDQ2078436.1 YqcC family protein [Marinimicrobium sp. ABcell2]